MNTTQQQTTNNGAPPIAYFFVAIGGGVVGHDYAQWFEADPLVGAGIGGAISLILTNILYRLYTDHDGTIKETCSGIGAFIGLIIGVTAVASNADGDMAWVIGGAIGGVIGYGLGQMAAAILSLGAFVLLFLSQGPIGFMIRTAILNSN